VESQVFTKLINSPKIIDTAVACLMLVCELIEKICIDVTRNILVRSVCSYIFCRVHLCISRLFPRKD